MKIWIGGEVEPHIIDSFRPIRNWVETKYNTHIEGKTFELSINKIRLCIVMRTNFAKEYCKHMKRDNSVEVVLNIDSSRFLNSSEIYQRKILFGKVIYAINWVASEIKESFDLLTQLTKEFDEKYIMPVYVEESLVQIREKYLHILNAGVNIHDTQVWNFFFFAETRDELEDMLLDIEGHSYEVLFDLTNDNYWRLKLSKKEQLGSEKLNRRNIYFQELAEYNFIHYDGWEVEKESGVPPQK